jgi:hypothetical protein
MTKPERPSVSDGFDLLAKNTELSLGEYTSITQSQADIELYLTQHLDTFSTVIFGAFSRKTIVSPLSGSIVDLLVLFRVTDVKHRHPSRIFSTLSDSLIKQYPDAYVLKNRNILMLPVKNFLYKIQPAYPISEHSYMLPAEYFDDWVKYDITSYNETFTKENVRHKGRLLAVIRMIKTWNRVSGDIFNGYYLELLVTSVLSSYEIKSYAETLRHIFKAAVSEVVFQKHDPANMEIQVEGLNDIDDLINAMILLNKSYKLADEAVILEQSGNTEKALEIWNQLFPQAFPTQLDMIVGKTRSAGIKGADALRMMIDHK